MTPTWSCRPRRSVRWVGDDTVEEVWFMTVALTVAYSCAASRSAHSVRIRMGEWDGRKSTTEKDTGALAYLDAFLSNDERKFTDARTY